MTNDNDRHIIEGCLSPSGEFFPCPYGKHNEFLINKYIELYSPGYSLLGVFDRLNAGREFPDKMIYERKWIICGRYFDGDIIITGPYGRWTEQQISKLREMYHDNVKILSKIDIHAED